MTLMFNPDTASFYPAFLRELGIAQASLPAGLLENAVCIAIEEVLHHLEDGDTFSS